MESKVRRSLLSLCLVMHKVRGNDRAVKLAGSAVISDGKPMDRSYVINTQLET